MFIGYTRVSCEESQDTAAQCDALSQAGVERIFSEKLSGGRWDRPELQRALEHLREGDVLVVHKLDRLSRSLKDLLMLLERIEAQGAGFRSVSESIDTTSPAGRMMMHIIGSFAEYEREMIRERTRSGLASARREGRIGGRRRALTGVQQKEVIRMVKRDGRTQADVARVFGVHPATVSRVVAQARQSSSVVC